MSDEAAPRYRAGDRLEDLCRSCKVLRSHTILAAGTEGSPLRVVCGYCGSQHNYRGGERARRASAPVGESRSVPERSGGGGTGVSRKESKPGDAAAFPLVSERERRYDVMNEEPGAGGRDLEMVLRRILREEMGLGPAIPAEKWRGGDLVLRPGKPGLQEKVWPIESFFHKVVMLRNRLRVLEQQVNASALPADEKLKLQGYLTGCYGTLTSFNILFAEEEDRFKGSGGEE